MKKNNKWQKKCSSLIVVATIIVLILIFLLIKSIDNLSVHYKIDSRVDNVANYKGETEDVKAIGWIRVQGTNIDYPVINNDENVKVGNIKEDFTWTQGEVEELPNKLFILGHNILNVSSKPLITNKDHTRFEQLMSYIYYDFAEENKYIQYTMNGEDYLYKIFSISIVEDDTLDYKSLNYTKEELKEYIKQSREDSYFEFDTDVDENDNIISLITCTRFYGISSDYTFKIDGRMIRKGEPVKNYEITKKDNYKEIEKEIRGDEDEQNA